MEITMKKFILFIAMIFISANLMASPISDAVEAGKAKEMPSGYVEAIDKSSAIVELVNKVNAGRKAEYEKIAKRNGVSVEAVGKASYEKRFGK
jgi:uncharacterized protein YdbL (DUF1318 family)